MQTYIKFLLIFGLFFCGSAVAQTDLTGTWQGKLDMGQDQKLTVQFIITKQADGSYKVVLNSPDTGGIKNVPATAVSYKDSELMLEVESLSGSYSGILDKGAITGEWRQPGSSLPLVLTPFKQPVLSAQDMKRLLGEWVGKLKVTDSLTYTLVFRFETNKEGKFVAFLDSVDQGANGIPATDVILEGDQLNLKVPSVQGEYSGKLGNNAISGTWKQPGFEKELNIAKGKYQPESKVDISAEAMEPLLGRWNGKLGPLSLVFRFEKNADGKYVVLIDSPDQGAKGIPVNEATLIDGTLSLKVTAVAGEYKGKLSGNKIDGTWTQAGQTNPLSLTKE